MNSEINQRIGNEIVGLEQNIKNLNQELFHSQKELELLKKLNNSNTKAKFSILNKEEKQIHYILKTIISENFWNKYELFSQIPFSAFIRIEGEKDFFYDYSRWYVDFLIARQTEKNGYFIFEPKCVIEYYGTGHYGDEKNDFTRKSVERRDKIKRLFLEKLEMPLLIIKNTKDKTLASNSKAFNDLKAYLKGFLGKIENSKKEPITEIIL